MASSPKRRTPALSRCSFSLSALSIVIPRSHTISDKTSLRVINSPRKLTSLEGERARSLRLGILDSRYALVGGYNRHINNETSVKLAFHFQNYDIIERERERVQESENVLRRKKKESKRCQLYREIVKI